MTVIELGDLRAARPGHESGRGWFDPRAVRRFTLAVVAVLCAATVTGSARPEPTLLRPVWSVPIGRDSFVNIVRSAVFVLSADAHPRVTAYELADGSVRWSKLLDASRTWLTAEEPGALMVPIELPDGVTAATVALDVRTGAELWRLPGDVVHSSPDSALLVTPGTTVRQVRISDGAVLWSRTVAGAQSWTVAGPEPRSARIVALTADGRVEVIRLADGTRMSSGRVPVGGGNPADAEIGADGGILYVNRTEQSTPTVTAYDLDTLRQRSRSPPRSCCCATR
jgi:outer membrane protein assembly factor BamB